MSVVGVKIAELPQLLTPQADDKIPVQHGQSTYKINYSDLKGEKGDTGDVTPEAQQALAAAQVAAQAASASAQTAAGSAQDAEDAADRAEAAMATKIDVSDIANNLITTTAGKVLDARQGKVLADDVGALSSAMTYVVSGNKSIETVTIPVGAYVRLVGSTIAGRSDGIYTVATAIPVDTVIDGTYFNESAPIPGGGLNAINSKPTTITILPGTTHAGGDGLATWDTTGINLQGKTLISVQIKYRGDNNWYLISQGSIGSVGVDINNNMPILYTNNSDIYGQPCRALYI